MFCSSTNTIYVKDDKCDPVSGECIGQTCIQRCPMGYWGSNCSQKCNCLNAANCSRETGRQISPQNAF